jgi:uncharacterized repeat protein (TIGR02543 family)
MKRSINAIAHAAATAVTAVFLLTLAGCDLMTGPESGQNAAQDGKAAVSLAIAGTDARTVAPTLDPDLMDVKEWELRGAKNGEDEDRLLKFTDPNKDAPLYLETGEWAFTLVGYNDSSLLILEGTIPNQTISLEGPNRLEFTVAPVLKGTGTVKITINLPEGHGIDGVKVFIDGVESGSITPNGNNVVYEAPHDAGNYYFSFRLYNKDEDLYGVVSELVKVRANLTSEGTYPLTVEDLNIIYSISYYVDGDPLSGESVQPEYYRSTDAPKLPTLSRLGYTFNGWHPDAALEEGPLTELPTPGTGGNRDFYAKWEIINYKINYELEGGSGYGDNPETYNVEDDDITLTKPIREGEDYIFLYWYVEGSPEIAVTTISKGSTEDRTFYAKWTPVYEIKYELDGKGTNHTENPAKYTVKDLPLTLKKPTPNSRYTFLYWYVDGSPEIAVTEILEGNTGEKTFYAKWHENGQPLASTADIGAYLVNADGGDSAENPIALPPVPISLADGGWAALLTAISGADKYVALDLSACIMSGTEFDPGAANNGESKIVSLVLPEAATSFKAGSNWENPSFRFFTTLTSVTGSGVVTIDEDVFRGLTALKTINLPKAITIGPRAFLECKALKTIVLSESITSIGGMAAFEGCSALETVTSPATSIGRYVFSYCTALKTVDLPNAISIGEGAFQGCEALTEISLPSATSISARAFQNTETTALTVILGLTAPTVENYAGMFNGVSNKTVIVKVPNGAEGYDEAWENRFKDGGTDINLTIEEAKEDDDDTP